MRVCSSRLADMFVCFGLFVIAFIVGIDRVDIASCLHSHFNDRGPMGANRGQRGPMGANGGQRGPMGANGDTGANGGQCGPTGSKGWASEQVTRIMSDVEPVIMSFSFSEVPAVEHQRGSLALCLKRTHCHMCTHTHTHTRTHRLLGLYGSCSWVSMALGSLWLLGLYGSIP